jgi:oligopeptide transport system ATP-binding protein
MNPDSLREDLLRIEGLDVAFETLAGRAVAVEGVSLRVSAGEWVCIVGESGSGKSQTLLSILGLSAADGRVSGSAEFRGKQLIGMSARELNRIRGCEIAFVFQDPMTALTPHLRIGTQLAEVVKRRHGVGGRTAWERGVEMLRRVRIRDPERRAQDYPHQLSGGMRQRVMIAMALLAEPRLIIADEPTTALDMTVQAEIVDLLKELGAATGVAIILVTHDMGLVADVAGRVVVMYAGRIVEEGSVESVLGDPRHPYTVGLLAAVPRFDRRADTGLKTVPGQPPEPGASRVGCLFAPRCGLCIERCAHEYPTLRETGGRRLACHVVNEAIRS